MHTPHVDGPDPLTAVIIIAVLLTWTVSLLVGAWLAA